MFLSSDTKINLALKPFIWYLYLIGYIIEYF